MPQLRFVEMIATTKLKLHSRLGMLFLLCVTCVGCDQYTKVIADQQLVNQPVRSYCADMVRIQYARNRGGFLSLGGSLSPTTRFWLLTVMNGLILGGALLFLLLRKNLPLSVWIAIGLIIAGGLGNLIDRVRLNGEVIDFLNVGIGSLRTGIFNIADMAILAGEIMAFYLFWQQGSQANKTQAANDSQEQTVEFSS